MRAYVIAKRGILALKAAEDLDLELEDVGRRGDEHVSDAGETQVEDVGVGAEDKSLDGLGALLEEGLVGIDVSGAEDALGGETAADVAGEALRGLLEAVGDDLVHLFGGLLVGTAEVGKDLVVDSGGGGVLGGASSGTKEQGCPCSRRREGAGGRRSAGGGCRRIRRGP